MRNGEKKRSFLKKYVTNRRKTKRLVRQEDRLTIQLSTTKIAQRSNPVKTRSQPHLTAISIALQCIILLLTFTWGLHLGKKQESKHATIPQTSSQALSSEKEDIPSRSDLTLQSKIASEQMDEILKKTIQEEIKTTHIQLEKPKSTKLPQDTKTAPIEVSAP